MLDTASLLEKIINYFKIYACLPIVVAVAAAVYEHFAVIARRVVIPHVEAGEAVAGLRRLHAGVNRARRWSVINIMYFIFMVQ